MVGTIMDPSKPHLQRNQKTTVCGSSRAGLSYRPKLRNNYYLSHSYYTHFLLSGELFRLESALCETQNYTCTTQLLLGHV